MFSKLNRIKLSEPQELWLKEKVDSFLAGEDTDNLAIKIKLHNKGVKDIQQPEIDTRLLRFGDPTVYGVWHIYPDHEIILQLENTIKFIRKIIFKEPNIE